jgi:hypothetical protein
MIDIEYSKNNNRKFNNTNIIIPQYCQTCNCIKENPNENFNHNSFCSVDCFNIASQKHGGGAILPLQMYQGEPCFILIKDGTRNEDITELPGGKKQIHEGAGKTCAREGTEELGLRKTIKHHYLEKNGIRLLTWFNKCEPINHFENTIEEGNCFNYTVYVIVIENFDIIEANLAARARQYDNNLKTEWKETESIFLVPIKNLELYFDNKTNDILDYKGKKIPPISKRWNNFLKNKNTLKIMRDVIFSKLNPWKVREYNQANRNSFVWSHKDLIH